MIYLRIYTSRSLQVPYVFEPPSPTENHSLSSSRAYTSIHLLRQRCSFCAWETSADARARSTAGPASVGSVPPTPPPSLSSVSAVSELVSVVSCISYLGLNHRLVKPPPGAGWRPRRGLRGVCCACAARLAAGRGVADQRRAPVQQRRRGAAAQTPKAPTRRCSRHPIAYLHLGHGCPTLAIQKSGWL